MIARAGGATRAAQVALEGRLADLRVHLALVFLLDPGLGGGIEEIEREVGLAFEHGKEASLDLSPERLLLAVLLGRVRERHVMHDAETLEALGGLGGLHRGAVAGEESPGQSTFLERLRQRVHEGLGGLVEIPLSVAAEARAIVEHAEQLRGALGAGGVEDGARAVVEVEVPEAVDVGDLVGAPLARREHIVVGRLAMATLAGAQEAEALHEAAEGRVAGNRSKPRVFAREREQVVVVELEAPSRVVAVLERDGLGQRRRHARVGAVTSA